jgi:hypothetical protein
MRVGKTREKLAEMINALIEENWPHEDLPPCAPEDIWVNRGGNRYNDWCSWTARVGKSPYAKSFASWETMTALVKRNKLTIIGNKNTHGPIELA